MQPTGYSRARRRWLLLAATAVIAIGLLTHSAGSGPLADFVGDALYAAMMFVLIAFIVPRARPVLVGGVAIVVCTLIELFQLTGLPATWAEQFWPVRLLLGSGFATLDLVAYGVGALLAAALDDALLNTLRWPADDVTPSDAPVDEEPLRGRPTSGSDMMRRSVLCPRSLTRRAGASA